MFSIGKKKTMPAPTPDPLGSSLCTECGICCAGAIFGHAVMREGDDVEGLAEAGMAVYRNDEGQPEYLLPCPKLDGACCTIYDIRPTVCHKFQCQLLVSVKGEHVPMETALEKVADGKEQIARIMAMLLEHGEDNESWPLITRYLLLMEKHEGDSDKPEYQERFAPLIEAVNAWQAFRTLWFWDDDNEIIEDYD